MWEIRNTTSYRGSLGRSILGYVLAAVIAAFLWVAFATTQAFAADASWSGNNVSYSGQDHQKRTADGTTPPGLSSGTSYYYRDEITNALTGEGKAHVIYFSGNEGSASTAKYTVYKLNSNGSYGGVEAAARDISITPKNSNASQPPSSTNAAWSGGNISFDGKTLTGQGGGARTADGSTPTQITAGSPYYMYSEITNALTGEGTAHVVFFPTGSDPKTASSARYATYSVSSDGTLRQRLSGPTNITVSPATTVNPDTGETESAESETASTCAIDGIGWIVCPVSTFLAEGMDWVFDQLRLFMEYNLLTGENRTIFQAWSVARNIANVAFVIAFIIIIYSQLTSMGIGNYGIKKLFPRLIIAAILVNLSYIICALAIDISNILGHAVQDLFVMLRESLTNANPNTMNSWASITGFVLAGGTAAAAGAAGLAIAVTSAGASPVAAALLLLPMLLTLLLAILVALVVLAARHAVITMLVILAPLAFVAYLLPNTEDWFTKWRKTFMTLLIFFPAFSLIFGGSQLAGFLIRDSSDQIAIILLGMFVQIAPLVLTPMLIKFSGSVVGRIANIVNNPNKGLIDRTKKWSQGQADYFAKKNMARTDPVRGRQVFRRFALGMDQINRAKDERIKVYDEQSNARWAATDEYSDIQQRLRQASDEKTLAETRVEQRYTKAKTVNATIQKLDIDIRNAKATVDNLGKEVDVQFKNLQTNASALNVIPAHLASSAIIARKQAQQTSVLDRQLHAADDMRQEQFAEAMIASEALQRQAGGIDPNGAQAALANAVSTMRSSYNKNVEEGRAINKHFNLSGDQRQNLSMGKTFVATDSHGNSRTFRNTDIFMREAAIEDQINGQGTVENATEIIAASGSTLKDFRTTISATMATSGFGAKTIWGGGKTINDVAQGKITNLDDVKRIVAETIAKGKVSAADLAKTDKDSLVFFAEAMNNLPMAKARITDPALRADFDNNVIALSAIARETLTGEERTNVKSNASPYITDIAKTTDPTFTPPKI